MKKILTHLTGIVFLITILVAGGCNSATAEDDPNGTREPLKKVTIYVKISEDDDGKKHLQMYDSYEPQSIVIDSLHVAEVDPGTKVVWKRADDSGIKKFKRIGPVESGEILPEDASTILLHKRYRANVPNKDLDSGTQQEYLIIYVTQGDNEELTSDPYLKIR